MTIVLSGTCSMDTVQYPRQQLEAIAQAAGHTVASSVNRRVDTVYVSTKAYQDRTTKVRDAEMLGCTVKPYSDFFVDMGASRFHENTWLYPHQGGFWVSGGKDQMKKAMWALHERFKGLFMMYNREDQLVHIMNRIGRTVARFRSWTHIFNAARDSSIHDLRDHFLSVEFRADEEARQQAAHAQMMQEQAERKARLKAECLERGWLWNDAWTEAEAQEHVEALREKVKNSVHPVARRKLKL